MATKKEFKMMSLGMTVLIIFCAFLILSMPYFLIKKSFIGGMDFTGTGQIGDTIGGITAPFIGIATSVLTFLAFFVQYKFNIQQNERIDKQDEEIKIDKFENRFYSLLSILRENIAEISIKDEYKSRRAFVYMFNEFRFCYYELSVINVENRYCLSENELTNISFLVFMFGIGNTSDDVIISILEPRFKDLLINYLMRLEQKQEIWSESMVNNFANIEEQDKVPGKIILKLNDELDRKITFMSKYKPFAGHLSRLGHYFRHLYHIVSYVENSTLSEDNKKDYIKTLRAQLSAHEQLLLYYNSYTSLGSSWRSNDNGKNLLLEYKLLRNIPIPLADFGPKIRVEYDEPNYFEWEQVEELFNR
ncbi:putative phage abortive infection protein [Siphonobacter curvatus]|uniref:Phage abortive infection protein n=1 Tax=Siphonobacter curvatus TaxID=2094562 RepID=A0A2S7IN70_9BACT|nr:putative phage abortive infection protein [Siphonobacter curvatus]PQA59181.1 hypothetical protein C5O19_05860 [Siphonobacter curvatus]